MGNTALHFAVADNNLEMAAMLLRYGAHRRLKNASSQGITACQVQVNSNISREIQAARISPMDKIIWPRLDRPKISSFSSLFFSQYPRQAPLENTLCIDFEMIGIANPQWGHHVMLDFPIEVGIVDSNLNTVYHRRCRPDFLPQTGKLSGKHFKKLYSPPIDRTLDRPSIDLRTWITGIRPGDLDFQVRKLVNQLLKLF
jgi:ankyrin repeat protein